MNVWCMCSVNVYVVNVCMCEAMCMCVKLCVCVCEYVFGDHQVRSSNFSNYLRRMK